MSTRRREAPRRFTAAGFGTVHVPAADVLQVVDVVAVTDADYGIPAGGGVCCPVG